MAFRRDDFPLLFWIGPNQAEQTLQREVVVIGHAARLPILRYFIGVLRRGCEVLVHPFPPEHVGSGEAELVSPIECATRWT